MSLQYKAYLIKSHQSNVKEIRRFTVDEGVTSSYDYLKNKVASVFPSVSEAFTLHYKDVEGDFISFSSDEELMQALAQVSDGLFRLYVKIKKDESRGRDGDCPSFSRYRFGSHYPHESHHRAFPHAPPHQPPPYQWFQGHGNWTPPNAWGFGLWGHPGPQGQQQRQMPGQNAQSFSSASADGRHQEQSQSQGTTGSSMNDMLKQGEEHLQNVGKCVADMLKPFGIDVDIDVEHHGQKSKCVESEIKRKQREEAEKEKASTSEETPPKSAETSEPMPCESQSAPSSPREGEWTVVVSDDDDEEPEPTETMNIDLPSDMNPQLAAALRQMQGMGFSDDGGWLSRLLEAHDFDIARALDAMQPHGGTRA